MSETNSSTQDLLINANSIPPMGMNLYYVTVNDFQNNKALEPELPQNLERFGTEVSSALSECQPYIVE